jgi:hypothetical protein
MSCDCCCFVLVVCCLSDVAAGCLCWGVFVLLSVGVRGPDRSAAARLCWCWWCVFGAAEQFFRGTLLLLLLFVSLWSCWASHCMQQQAMMRAIALLASGSRQGCTDPPRGKSCDAGG